jgi:hypothetical protein
MLKRMSISDWRRMTRILDEHEAELIEDALAEVPRVLLGLKPEVAFECTHDGIRRWLVFGQPPRAEWLELSSLSYYVLDERYVDTGAR